MTEERRARFAVRVLETNPASRGGDESLPTWKKEARELMAGLRNDLSESRARWAEENATRRERTMEFMAELRAQYGHGRPGEQSPDMEEVDCGYCGGQGSLPRTVKCPVCWGKGKVLVRAPYEKCDLCRGTGHVPGLALTCSKCNGKGWVHAQRKPNACPRCRGSGLEPVEETSLAALRERRRRGLPPPRRGIGRPLCPLCEGSGVTDWLDARATPAGSLNEGLAGLQASEPEASEGQPSARPKPASRDPLSLAENVLGYIMSYPGVRSEDIETVLGQSESEVAGALQSLVASGRLRMEEGLYYLTPSALGGPANSRPPGGFSTEAREFVGRLVKALGHPKERAVDDRGNAQAI